MSERRRQSRRRLCAPVLLLALACASWAGCAFLGEHKAPRLSPNFVVVLADDLGYGDLGCYGAKNSCTPNLDRMAAEGTRFTDFYVAQAVCSASRAALLTGCYPNRVGILGALGPMNHNGLGSREKTIADLLKSRGYATAALGKWHLGHHAPFLPTRHGFDTFFGLPYSHDMGPFCTHVKCPPLPLLEGDRTVATNPDLDELTVRTTERAVRFIADNKDRPFFLYLAHHVPHVPLHASPRFKGKSGQGLYSDVLMEIDWSVGQVLEALRAQGVDNRTMVLFTSDNGPWLCYGNHAGSSGPLREGKGTTWEGGVRVPCLARWPGRIPAGRVCREPAMTIDVLPTLARLAGAPLPRQRIDGKDVWPLVSGQHGARSPQEAYYFYCYRHLQAVRSGPWKLHFPHAYRTLGNQQPGRDGRPARTFEDQTRLALYNLEDDPGESTNLADQFPDVVERLQKLGDKARADLGDGSLLPGRGVRVAGQF